MKKRPFIKLKVTLLLIVFMFNTVLGFACSLGLNFKYNVSYHGEENVTSIHQHPGSDHHEEKPVSSHKHDGSHSHDPAISGQQEAENTKDDCCSDGVIKFAQLDKRFPQFPEFSFQPGFFVLLFTGADNFDGPAPKKLKIQSGYNVRSYHPSIPQIRIAIRSFQI